MVPRAIDARGETACSGISATPLLDNDRVTADLQHRLRRQGGSDRAARYWALFEPIARSRVTTVFPRQEHCAHDLSMATLPAADVTVERIGDLDDCDLPALLDRAATGARAGSGSER